MAENFRAVAPDDLVAAAVRAVLSRSPLMAPLGDPVPESRRLDIVQRVREVVEEQRAGAEDSDFDLAGWGVLDSHLRVSEDLAPAISLGPLHAGSVGEAYVGRDSMALGSVLAWVDERTFAVLPIEDSSCNGIEVWYGATGGAMFPGFTRAFVSFPQPDLVLFGAMSVDWEAQEDEIFLQRTAGPQEGYLGELANCSYLSVPHLRRLLSAALLSAEGFARVPGELLCAGLPEPPMISQDYETQVHTDFRSSLTAAAGLSDYEWREWVSDMRKAAAERTGHETAAEDAVRALWPDIPGLRADC